MWEEPAETADNIKAGKGYLPKRPRSYVAKHIEGKLLAMGWLENIQRDKMVEVGEKQRMNY